MAYGRGWEVAVVAAAVVLFVLGLVALLAVAVASRVFGEGWIWPHGAGAAARALGGVVTGDPGHGLPAEAEHRLANAGVVYSAIGLFEAAAVAALACTGVALVRRLRNDGMATRTEARQALGRAALLSAAPIIRPDLATDGRKVFPTQRRRPQAFRLESKDRRWSRRSVLSIGRRRS